MARPKGSRDRNYEQRRLALLAAARTYLATPAGHRASWRDLAAHCGVTVPTMTHYFVNRSTLISSILQQAEAEGSRYLNWARQPSGSFEKSTLDLVDMLSAGFANGVLSLQVIGLGEGFGDQSVSSSYLGHHLEPIIGAIAERLAVHVARGEMRQGETRFAAIELISPVLLAHLHQTSLGGKADYPMALPDFVAHHAHAFTRAHAALAPNDIMQESHIA